MSKRPYNVESFVDDYGRLGDARRIGPSGNDGPIRCPHGDAVAVLEMDDFFAAFVPNGHATEVTEQEE